MIDPLPFLLFTAGSMCLFVFWLLFSKTGYCLLRSSDFDFLIKYIYCALFSLISLIIGVSCVGYAISISDVTDLLLSIPSSIVILVAFFVLFKYVKPEEQN